MKRFRYLLWAIIFMLPAVAGCKKDKMDPEPDPELPVVSTFSSITAITQVTATGGGDVVSDGGSEVTDRGICWSVSQNPTLSDNQIPAGKGTGKFTAGITGLTPETTYYVRAYAVNAAGTAYGDPVRFSTLTTTGGFFIPDITPGNLQTVVGEHKMEYITNLKLKGSIDQRDFVYMRSMIFDGNLEEIDLEGVTIVEYTDPATSVTYPANEIPDYAFVLKKNGVMAFCEDFKRIIFPTNLEAIGNYALAFHLGLEMELVIPDGVKSIGENAFRFCTFKGSLFIPDNVESIGDYAFFGCDGFDGPLVIGNGVKTIGEKAFYSCGGFKGPLIIGSSVETIGAFAFYSPHSDYSSLEISNSVKTIGEQAFAHGRFKGSLIIPDNVIAIGEEAFMNCSGFDKLILGDGIEIIEKRTFWECNGFTGSLIIPDHVKIIRESAFGFCRGFNGELVIGNGVETIEKEAFFSCYGFTGSLVIPDNVKTIGIGALYTCYEISDIKMMNAVPIPYAGAMLPTVPVYVPAGSVAAYQAAEGWGNYDIFPIL